MDAGDARERRLAVDGLVNGRDLGGLARASGSDTPRGVFFRSENVDVVPESGWQQLYALGIRTVVDLREQTERDRDIHLRPAWLTTIHVDLNGVENTDFWSQYWDNGLFASALYFLPHLDAMPERAGAALSALVDAPPGAVLFHCGAGRDRTGLLSMLLLAAVGVQTDAIVNDYLETIRLGDVRAGARQATNSEPRLDELCRRFGTTPEQAFRDALRGIDLGRLWASAGLSARHRTGLRTWRGTIPSDEVNGTP